METLAATGSWAAQSSIDVWVHAYHHSRPHQSIGMVTPAGLFRPPLAGRLVTVWANLRSIHFLIDDQLVRTRPSKLSSADLAAVRPAQRSSGSTRTGDLRRAAAGIGARCHRN